MHSKHLHSMYIYMQIYFAFIRQPVWRADSVYGSQGFRHRIGEFAQFHGEGWIVGWPIVIQSESDNFKTPLTKIRIP